MRWSFGRIRSRARGTIVTLVSTSRDNGFDSFSYREYLDIRDHAKSYEGVVANAPLGTVGFSAERGATPVARGGMLVSGNFFRVLGVEPRLGRGFREDEDEVPGRNAVAVLGPDFWRREFAGDPSVVGRTVRLNATDFTVIGVAPESFPGMLVFGRPDFYMPLAMARVFSTGPQKDFFRGSRRSPVERQGAPETGDDAARRRATSSPSSRGTSSANIRSSIATAARRCAPSSRCGRRTMTSTGSSA